MGNYGEMLPTIIAEGNVRWLLIEYVVARNHAHVNKPQPLCITNDIVINAIDGKYNSAYCTQHKPQRWLRVHYCCVQCSCKVIVV